MCARVHIRVLTSVVEGAGMIPNARSKTREKAEVPRQTSAER